MISLSHLAPPIKVNRIIYDGGTNCVLAKPDGVLESGKHYALVATNAIRDIAGKPVQADPRFTNAFAINLGLIGKLLPILSQLTRQIVGASAFTTLSATDWIQKAHKYVAGDPLAGVIAPGFTVAKLDELTSITWLAQTKWTSTTGVPVPLNLLGGVGRIAVGTYLSPNFLSATPAIPQVPILTIPQEPTTRPVTPQPYVIPFPGVPVGYAPISFHVFLPSGPKPQNGFPVAIYGHGIGDNQWVGATAYIASTLAQKGIALIGVEVFGHGFGPGSQVQLARKNGSTDTLPSPGRTMPTPAGDFNPDTGGCILLPGPFATRDCFRQTAVDIFTLVKLMSAQNGLAAQLDIDANRIMYIGQSFGSVMGPMIVATDPRIKAAVLNVGGGPAVDVARLQRPPVLAGLYLQTRTPPLLLPDVFAFRGQVITGSSVVPKVFDVAEWINMPGDPLAFASGLRNKPVLFQIALGDEEVPNPTNSNLIRAAGGQASTWLYRADRAVKIATPGTLPPQPHRFLSDDHIYDSPARTSISKAAQRQVAEFLSSGGKNVVDPDEYLDAPFKKGDKLFEIPNDLPDTLNYQP